MSGLIAKRIEGWMRGPAVAAGRFVAAALVAAIAAAGPVGAQTADENAAAGSQALRAGDLETARRVFMAALGADPNHCWANYGMVRVALAHGDPATATAHVARVRKAKGCAEIAVVGEALVRLHEGKLDESEALLYKIANKELTPDIRREAEEAFVAIYEAKGYPMMVIEHLDKLIAVSDPTAALHLKKGRILNGEKRYDAALAAFREAIAADSMASDAYREIADLYIRAKRHADAAEILERLAEAQRDASAYLIAAEAWIAADRTEEASRAYARAVAIDSLSTAGWLGVARTSAELGRHDEMMAAYDRLGDPRTRGAKDYVNIGRALVSAKRYPEARESYLQALAIDSTLSDAMFYVGYTHFAERNFADAAPYFERVVALDSSSAAGFVNLGLSRLQTGQTGRAIEALQRALALRPGDNGTRVWLAQAFATQSQWSKAVAEYKTVLDSVPDNGDALRGLGYCLLNMERFGEAVGVLERARAADPENLQGLVWLAQGYGLANDIEKAEATFRKVLAVDPNSREAKEGLATIEKSRKRTRKSG